MMLRPRSLQGRLLVLVLGLVVAVWLATAAITWLDARRQLDELLDSHLAQAAALLVVQQTEEREEGERGLDAPLLHRYAPRVAFQVFHAGQLVQRSVNAPIQPMVAGIADSGGEFQTVVFSGSTWRVFAAHGAERDVEVFVGEQVDSREDILWAVLRSTLWPMLVALPALAGAVWWAIRRGVAPIRRLASTLEQRSPQALEPVVVADAPSELTPMVGALNDLLLRTAHLVEKERRFTADAAHELRTPIAAIRAQAQVALAATESSERSHALEFTLLGCDRAARLVEQLLTLSRIESGAAPLRGAVDLSAVCRRVVAEVVPAALDKNQDIGVTADDGCVVAGEGTLLTVLVRNLVDNAVRYSPVEATVAVTVARTDGGVRLTVEDSGPGMNSANIARLGERFFRVVGTHQDGSGLGWSIVKRIATVHSATWRISKSESLHGLCVVVEFPVVIPQWAPPGDYAEERTDIGCREPISGGPGRSDGMN
jgi:two-component system sensor histidine kinase QseC